MLARSLHRLAAALIALLIVASAGPSTPAPAAGQVDQQSSRTQYSDAKLRAFVAAMAEVNEQGARGRDEVGRIMEDAEGITVDEYREILGEWRGGDERLGERMRAIIAEFRERHGSVGPYAVPEDTFEALVAAIENRDLDAYAACFMPDARETEAGIEDAKRNPEAFWRELGRILRGPQTFTITTEGASEEALWLAPVGARVSAELTGPDGAGGGIGHIRFEKTEDGWKIRNW